MERYADFTEFISAQGRGKTKNLVDILKYKVEVKGERAIVILPDTSEPAWFDYPIIYSDDLEETFDKDFKGIICIEYEENETFEFLYNQFKRSGLKRLNFVLDDPYYVEGRPEKPLIRILARKRQYEIDIFSNAHSYDQVPAIFFPYISIFAVGFTETEIVNRKQQLGADYPVHCKLRRNINAYAGTDKTNKNYYNFLFFKRNGEILRK
jgi:hypothetical protein